MLASLPDSKLHDADATVYLTKCCDQQVAGIQETIKPIVEIVRNHSKLHGKFYLRPVLEGLRLEFKP